ncbi:MAG: linear amide C-N hydrolase [Bacilli bacterium]|nr:linear amide C-N hydrolase [Bacilli bacterium]
MRIKEKMWKGDVIEHKGFKDLGNYVIELPEYTDPNLFEEALALGNMIADNIELPKVGCTAMAKRNSKGEIITGRNMDLDISQSPAYVFKNSAGKYKTFCISYSPGFYLPYEEVRKLDEIDPNMKKMIALTPCDCINEKGLYMEVNLREKNDRFVCYGLHSAHGEVTRNDGKPWKELRANTTNLVPLVVTNCATVKEAVEFIKNSYDWYTISPKPGANMAVVQNNMCFLIGDATGEYGVIEIAQDEVNFIPYQFGHANFYLTPKWNALETYGSGQGRLQMVSRVIQAPDTLEEMMKGMEHIMWRNEVLWIGETVRVTDGSRLHPYSQIKFQDCDGNETLDWRGDYHMLWPVLDDGRLILLKEVYDAAKKSDYDPMILKYIEDGIRSGRLVIDDGSFLFDVEGKKVGLEELTEKHNAYLNDGKLEYKAYYEKYWSLITQETSEWVYNDKNFEALKGAVYAKLHIRYDDAGKFDPSAMSKYEKMCAYYGFNRKRDEKPLRDDGNIWTTSINVGVNCAQKELKVRFWENDEIVFHVKF